MDLRERLGSDIVALKAVLDGWQATMWTAIPGIYQGPGIGKGTAKVQPAVKGWVWDDKGKPSPTQYPICINCPILWPGGGGFHMTFPLTAGVSEGLLIFSARSIDAWWKQGGVQPQVDFRKHDLSDGFFLPSPCGQATAADSASSNTAQLRSSDGSTYLELAGGNIVNIVAPGGLKITADVTITGKLSTTDDVTAGAKLSVTGDVAAGAKLNVTGDVAAGAKLSVTGNVKASAALEVDGALTALNGAAVTGMIATIGAVTATGAITAGVGSGDSIGLQTHKHPANNFAPTPGT